MAAAPAGHEGAPKFHPHHPIKGEPSILVGLLFVLTIGYWLSRSKWRPVKWLGNGIFGLMALGVVVITGLWLDNYFFPER